MNHHTIQTWDTSSSQDAPTNDAIEPLRAAVQAALDTYMAQQYVDGSDAKNAAAVYATADDTLVCCLAGTATNLRNWWSGGWKGEFTIKLDASASSAQVKGKCDLLAHYFEDGNVQMNTSREYSEDGVGFGGADELGSAVVGMIKRWESSLQAGLETMYTGMSDQTFKDMRRILPVTSTKFDWSGQQQKLAGGAGNGTL